MCYFYMRYLYIIIIHEMNGLEIYILVFFPGMGSIDFWLYKLFYMRCNLLEGKFLITVFSLLVLLIYF